MEAWVANLIFPYALTGIRPDVFSRWPMGRLLVGRNGAAASLRAALCPVPGTGGRCLPPVAVLLSGRARERSSCSSAPTAP